MQTNVVEYLSRDTWMTKQESDSIITNGVTESARQEMKYNNFNFNIQETEKDFREESDMLLFCEVSKLPLLHHIFHLSHQSERCDSISLQNILSQNSETSKDLDLRI
jgi:hypothetical protein